MSRTCRYLLVEGGAVLKEAKRLRREMDEWRKAILVFVYKHGFKGFYPSNGVFESELRFNSMVPLPGKDIPPDWRLSRIRGQSFLTPRKKASALQAEIAALPTCAEPGWGIGDFIGWKTVLITEHRCGNKHTTMASVRLGWAGNTFGIVLPMHALFGAADPDVVEHVMAFQVPDGCREITEAEWELIVSRYRVSQERKRVRQKEAA